MNLKNFLLFFNKNKKIIILCSLILLGIFLIVFLSYLFFVHQNSGKDFSDLKIFSNYNGEKKACEKHLAISGECIGDDSLEFPPIAAVMIENHSDSRPQAGLSDAPIVFEAEVEGHITRFLAIFPLGTSLNTEKIGPVRSARPYYLDWAKEFDSLYAHVGGSPEALEKIDVYNVEDLDQFFWSNYFWRSNDRYAPHNVYTSLDLLVQAAEKKNINLKSESEYGAWKFKEDLKKEERPLNVKDLIINFSSGITYKVAWKYDLENNNYIRYIADDKHLAENGAEIKANNICIVFTDFEAIDNEGRLSMETIGKGKAIVFQDGKTISASWEKKSMNERLRFFDSDNKELEFNAGKTWIEVVNDNVDIEY